MMAPQSEQVIESVSDTVTFESPVTLASWAREVGASRRRCSSSERSLMALSRRGVPGMPGAGEPSPLSALVVGMSAALLVVLSARCRGLTLFS